MYSNFTASAVPVPNIMQGSTISTSVTITQGASNYSHQVMVYIDFNRDGDFTDAGGVVSCMGLCK